MTKELLTIVEVVANEKDVARETIFEALEAALAAATRRRYNDEQLGVQVYIDRKTGAYETFRVWQIMDDDDILENPNAQMRETVARIEFKDNTLRAGQLHLIPIENEPFGRISAQIAKQMIIQKLREAEREKIYQQFADKEGSLVYGTIRRYERGNVILDINGVEGTILRNDMIPRESLRIGDRVQGYLAKVNHEMRGPQLQLSRIAPEFLTLLFRKEVPEISAGNVEIMGAARDPGLRAKIAVRTFDPRIDPVGACVGIRGSRVQGVMNELAGERIDIVLWDENVEDYVKKAMAPAVITKTFIEEDNHLVYIAVPDDKLAQAVGRGGQNVRLASELTGWSINVMSEQEFANKMASLQDVRASDLAQTLDISVDIARAILAAGLTSAEEVAYADRADLLNIADIDEATVDVILEQATDYLLTQAFVAQNSPEIVMQTPVEEIDELSEEYKQILIDNGICTQKDLAELSTDELITLTGMDNKAASSLILQVREPWFQ